MAFLLGVLLSDIQLDETRSRQNGRVEKFIDKLREELLRTEIYACGAELLDSLTDFSDHYNKHRPRRSRGLKSPRALRDRLLTNPEAETLTR